MSIPFPEIIVAVFDVCSRNTSMFHQGFFRHRLDRFFHLRGIAEVIMADGMKFFVQFVNKGNSCRNVNVYDFGVRDVVEILHKRTEAVAVSRNKDGPPALQRRGNAVVPVWKKPRSGILQAFG